MHEKRVPGGDTVRAYVRQMQIGSVISGVGVAAVLALLVSVKVGGGFLAGAAISIVNFQLMAVDAFEFAGKSPKVAKKFIIGRYLLRYAIMFAAVVMIVTRTDFNIIATFAGLFFVQVRLFASHIYSSVTHGGGMFRSLK